MDELKCYDTEALEEELRRREREEREQAKPQPIDNPDWSRVQQNCEEYIDRIHVAGEPPKDAKQYIFEAAIEAVYGGRDVWHWINSNQWAV